MPFFIEVSSLITDELSDTYTQPHYISLKHMTGNTAFLHSFSVTTMLAEQQGRTSFPK